MTIEMPHPGGRRVEGILLLGESPEFGPLAALLREAGIPAIHRTGKAPTRSQMSVCAVVCDTEQARRVLTAEADTPCVVVMDDRSPSAITEWLELGAAACVVRPVPLPFLLQSILDSLPPLSRGPVEPN